MTFWRLCCPAICGVVASVMLLASPASAAPPLREVIDGEVRAAWQREKIVPSATATDAEFFRRVSLDIVGVIPTHDETVAFLEDSSPHKRSQWIDRLLDDPRYARHMAELWDVTTRALPVSVWYTAISPTDSRL